MPHRRPKAALVTFLAVAAAPGVGVGACAGRSPGPAAGNARTPASMSASSTTVAPANAPGAATAVAPVAPVQAPNAAPLPSAPVPQSAFARTKTDPSWAACHQSYKATAKDVSREVASMATACGKQTKMNVVGKTMTGKQTAEEKPQSFPLDAKANHCYRVYAQAVDGIKDLDLAIKDSAGIIVGQDSTDDPSPVVLEDGAVCFAKDDKATIVVSVGMGSGAYAVQVWGD